MKRNRSERRAAASRANGAKSRGPVTARGKYNSSLNATRHGILARSLVLPGERPDLFTTLYNDFMEEHQPRTPTERALVEEMVTSWWRKQRIWGLEGARITHQVAMSASMGQAVPVPGLGPGLGNDPATRTALAISDLADTGRSLDLFLRYETRYERQFHRALARLLDLQSRDPQPDNLPESGEISKQTPEPAENTSAPGPGPAAEPLPSPVGNAPFPAPQLPSPDLIVPALEPLAASLPASALLPNDPEKSLKTHGGASQVCPHPPAHSWPLPAHPPAPPRHTAAALTRTARAS